MYNRFFDYINDQRVSGWTSMGIRWSLDHELIDGDGNPTNVIGDPMKQVHINKNKLLGDSLGTSIVPFPMIQTVLTAMYKDEYYLYS